MLWATREGPHSSYRLRAPALMGISLSPMGDAVGPPYQVDDRLL
jgi:hypothetical protein